MSLNRTTDPVRLAAAEAGLKTYVGTPCRAAGHTLRSVESGGCVTCKEHHRKAWASSNKPRINELARDRYKTDPTRKRESALRWSQQNVTTHRARSRRWHFANREQAAERSRQWRATNADIVREKKQVYHSANREAVKAAQKIWREAHPEKRRESHQKRRASKRGAEGSFTHNDISTILYLQGGHCSYCEVSYDLHLDHVIPLSRGGSNWPFNLQWLCAYHNISKNDLTDIEYRSLKGLPSIGRHLSLSLWMAAFAL